jgi:hypothetical protein
MMTRNVSAVGAILDPWLEPMLILVCKTCNFRISGKISSGEQELIIKRTKC